MDKSEEGYLTTDDGIRIYYEKIGAGSQTVIIPARLFLFEDFRRLALGRTLIFYDMRNRGRSDPVADPQKISFLRDVDDIEAVRQHFKIGKPQLIGYSYLGALVILYAWRYSQHVDRIVQVGPLFFEPKQYPASLIASDRVPVPDAADVARLKALYDSGYAREHPREYCEQEWQVMRYQLVGNPANVDKLGPSKCEMPNEWLEHRNAHFETLIGTLAQVGFSRADATEITASVLTIHGTKDRNAPYGCGREWSLILPNARLITIPGAAHHSWVEAPDIVFSAIDTFLNGKWPDRAEKISVL